MPDSSSTLHEIKISELPVAPNANATDQLEANQAGTSRSITVGQVAGAVFAGGPGIPAGATSVPTVAALKAITVPPAVVVTQGYNTVGDGGGGPPWIWVAGSTATPDDFMTVALPSSATGRYVRQLQAGANVSPKWAGCGLGAADDTAQFQVVLNAPGGYAVDISGCTLPVTGVTVHETMTCPGIFSNNSGTINCAPGTTTGTFLFRIFKSDFFVDRVFFDAPISTVSGTSPLCATHLSVEIPTPAAETDRFRITNCRFRGSNSQLQFRNTNFSAYTWVQSNVFTDAWGIAVNMLTGKQAVISQNMFYHCGCGTGASQGVLAITTQNTVQTENVIVTNNIWRDCQIGVGQEAIDFNSNGERNVLIAGNICDNVEHGFLEFKSADTSALAYGDVEVCNNIVNFAPGLTGAGVTLVNITTIDHKHKKYKIHGNYFLDDSGTSTNIGVSLGAHDNVTVDGNTFAGVYQGITINASGGATQTCFSATISNNTFNTRDIAIGVPGRTVSGLIITGNAVVSTGKQPVSFNGAVSITGLRCSYNYFETTAAGTQAMILCAVAGGLITHNTFICTHVGLDFQTTNCSNLRIVQNDIQGAFRAFNVNLSGTGNVFAENTVVGPDSQEIVGNTAAASVVSWGNKRAARSTAPTGVVAGTVGDIVPNSAPAAGGIKEWICTTSGTSGTAVWKAVAIAP